MRTFTESLKISTNLKLLKESFVLMSQRGIDPMNFVEWYTTDGILQQDQGLILEASEQWLEAKVANWVRDMAGQKGLGQFTNKLGSMAGSAAAGGIDALKGLGGAAYDNAKSAATKMGASFNATKNWGNETPQPSDFDQHSKNAADAIDALSKRMSKSKDLFNRMGGQQIQAAVVNMLNMLKNPASIQNQQAQPEQQPEQQPLGRPQPQTPPQNQRTTYAYGNDDEPYESTGYGNFTKAIRVQNEIRSGLRTLQSEYNIDPQKFVTWYFDEGRHLNLDEAWYDGLANTWSNIKDAWGNMKKSWGAAGQQRQIQADTQRDEDAIKNAMDALKGLRSQSGNATDEFSSLLDAIMGALRRAQNTPPQSQSQQPDQQSGQTQNQQPNQQSGNQIPDPAWAPNVYNRLNDHEKQWVSQEIERIWRRARDHVNNGGASA